MYYIIILLILAFRLHQKQSQRFKIFLGGGGGGMPPEPPKRTQGMEACPCILASTPTYSLQPPIYLAVSSLHVCMYITVKNKGCFSPKNVWVKFRRNRRGQFHLLYGLKSRICKITWTMCMVVFTIIILCREIITICIYPLVLYLTRNYCQNNIIIIHNYYIFNNILMKKKQKYACKCKTLIIHAASSCM